MPRYMRRRISARCAARGSRWAPSAPAARQGRARPPRGGRPASAATPGRTPRRGRLRASLQPPSSAPARRRDRSPRHAGLLLAEARVGDRRGVARELARSRLGSRRTCDAASSAKRDSITRRSTTSACAVKSCWRRSPSLSMSRWTKRSGRMVSSPAAVARRSFRKRRMRSRDSGGIWGDSFAATSAATMSRRRRRAICTQRARSTAPSSIGGRDRARTTAAASDGSTRSRSQASRSRTSGAPKKASTPRSR